MKRKLVVVGMAVIIVAGIAAFNQWRPERLTASTLEKAREVQQKLDLASQRTAVAQAEAKPAEAPKPEAAKPGEPKVFKVKFECSNGTFVVEVHPEWAPLGAARFEQLLKEAFYNECRFFRVMPGFVVQFGLSGNPEINKKWRDNRIKDDPVKQTNSAGTLTFATSGPNARTTQLFINLVDNPRLDGMGFAPFGKVVEGTDVVKAINPQYRDSPEQARIQAEGNAYLQQAFPKLDYIKSATIVP